MPANEQWGLREKLGWLSDPGDVIVEVHDWKGSDRKRPRAVVIFCNRLEEIDILASVKHNVTSIGHPAILCAIKRWEEITICQGALPIARNVRLSDADGEYFAEETDKERAERLRSGLTRREYDRRYRNKLYQDFHERTGQHINFARIAKDHLKNLSMCLIEGAESRAWSKEQAFHVYRNKVFAASYSYLQLTFKVWGKSRELSVGKLMSTVIERFRTYGFGDNRLGSPLAEELANRVGGFDDVRAFLRSAAGKKVLNGRQQWKAWKGAFDAWRFPTLTPHTQRAYLKEAKSQATGVKVRRSSLTPKSNSYQLSDMTAGFDLPTIPSKA